MIALSLNALWARRRRLVSTTMAVALGVAFLTGTLLLGDTLSANFERLFTDVSAGTDVVVRNGIEVDPGGAPDDDRGLIDGSLADTLRGVDGVAGVEGQVVGYGSLTGADGKAVGGNGPPRQAGSWVTDPALNPYELVEGRAPEAPDEVVVNRGAAKAGDLHLGDTTTVQTPEPVAVRIVGIATFGGTDGLGQTTWTAFTLEAAQDQVTRQPGEVTSLLVTAAPGVSSDALRDRVAEVVPSGVEAITGRALAEERTDEIGRTFLNFLRTFLVAFAVIALAVATLTITNTFSITVAQRSQELALLRAVGASRRQVRRSVTIEALVIGFVAGLIGLVGGIGVAGLLKGLFDAFGGALPAGGLAVRPLALVIGLVAGIAVTTIAAQVPARRASRVAPIEAMREAEAAGERPSTTRKVLAAAPMGVGVAAVAGGLAGEAGLLVAVGAALTVVGVLVAGPLLVGPAMRLLGVVARRISPRSGRLAVDNARRQPRRSAATATALVIGVAVVSMCTVFAASLRASLASDIDDGFAADLAVTTPVFGGSQLSPRAADDLSVVPGVDGVVGLGGGPVLIGGDTNTVTATDVARLPAAVRLDVERGSLAAVGTDGVAVSRSKADDEGWDLGSPVELTFTDGATERLTVRAVYADQRLVGGVVIEGATWQAHVTQASLRAVFLDLADGASPETVRAAVEPIADRFGGSVEDRAEYTASSTRGLDLLLGIVYVLLALAVVIALAGIANALSLATHERRREIGLLRAVGQTRRQSRAVLRLEACLVSTFGTGVGLVVGCLGGWVLFSAVTGGDDRTFALPLARVVVIAVVGALAGVLAAARPGRRAARLPILEAVAAP